MSVTKVLSGLVLYFVGSSILVMDQARGQVNSCLDSCQANSNGTLDLSYCEIGDSDAQDLVACFDNAGRDNIKQLYLNDNSMNSLEVGVFDGLGALVHLDLSWNNLDIEAGVFDGLGALVSLRLTFNGLTSLEAGSFDGLGALESLDLDDNSLISIQAGVFDGLGALQILSLYDNPLTSLEAGAFDGLGALQFLVLRSNLRNRGLTSLEPGIFDDLGALEWLDLEDHDIPSLPTGGFDALTRLLMDGNNITALEVGDFDGLGALEYLDLGRNLITFVEDGVFDGLGALVHLSLSANDFETLPDGVFNALGSLETLMLYNTVLTSLPAGIFNGLGALKELWLTSDYLECIPSLPPNLDSFIGDESLPTCGLTSTPTPATSVGPTPGPTTAPELVDARLRTTVTEYASAYDTRTSLPRGCSPGGCTADLTRDQDLSDMSRWSCMEDLEDDQCVIYYNFEEPQDIVSIKIKFYKGDERIRKIKLVGSGGFYKIITSSGTASGFETFELNTDETASLSMEALGNDGDEWISITEVEFMVK